MLAAIREFLHPWQFIHLTIFATAWVLGGGWLLLRALRKASYPKRMKLVSCAGLVILAGSTAVVAGLAFFTMAHRLTGALPNKVSLICSAVFAAVVMAATALVVIYAMLDLSFARSIRVSLMPLLLLAALGALLGTDAGIRSVQIRRAISRRNKCRDNITYILRALRTYQRNTGLPADTLARLVDGGLLDSKHLSCPATASQELEYFYHPARLTDPQEYTTKLLLCDRKGNHPDGRNVLKTSGQIEWYTHSEFLHCLNEADNKAFAGALTQAESPGS